MKVLICTSCGQIRYVDDIIQACYCNCGDKMIFLREVKEE